jgi:hypothetical protein
MADDVLARAEVVELHVGAEPGLTATDVIRRADGMIVAAGVGEARWSTVELIEIEHRLVDQAVTRAGTVTGIVGWRTVVDTLAERPSLSGEQATMVRRLTNSGNGVEVVCAAAGTGKTFTLDAARDAWERAGYTVRGAALAGRAAQELQSSAAIPSSTLARLHLDLNAGTTRLVARSVVVIDEAGMAGTRTLAPILDTARVAGTKVVLVGDTHQLPEIDAGGALAGLVDRLDPIELVENRRQRDQWERNALLELRAGDVDTALDAYRTHGRIIHAPTAGQVRQAMVADWWAHRVAGDSVAMMAIRRSDVDDLNGRARAYLKQRGDVSGPEVVVNQRRFQAGDDIICLRNNRRLGVCNGTRATITSVDPDRHTLDIQIGHHNVRLTADYLAGGHIAHAYATTIHKIQGATFDHGLLLGTDALYRTRGYVGMSRGRISNRLYLVGAQPVDDATGHGPPPLGADPADVVRRALQQDNDQQRLAIDTGDPLDTWPIDALISEKHRLQQLLAAGPPDRSVDIRALTDRHDTLMSENDKLAKRHDQLASRRLRGPATRAEICDLQDQLDARTATVDKIDRDSGPRNATPRDTMSSSLRTRRAGDASPPSTPPSTAKSPNASTSTPSTPAPTSSASSDPSPPTHGDSPAGNKAPPSSKPTTSVPTTTPKPQYVHSYSATPPKQPNYAPASTPSSNPTTTRPSTATATSDSASRKTSIPRRYFGGHIGPSARGSAGEGPLFCSPARESEAGRWHIEPKQTVFGPAGLACGCSISALAADRRARLGCQRAGSAWRILRYCLSCACRYGGAERVGRCVRSTAPPRPIRCHRPCPADG